MRKFTNFIFNLIIIIELIFIIACSQGQVPSNEIVSKILENLNELDRPLGLAIIAATPPPRGPKNPLSIIDNKILLERAKKEKKI